MVGRLRFALATIVIPRACRGSSTPRPFDSIISISGILDRPLSRTMTAESVAHSYSSNARLRPAARCARAVHLSRAPLRAWGMPGARCTHSPACEVGSAHGSSPQVHRDHPAFPHAMVLTASFVLSPVTGLVCHRHQRIKVLSLPGWADKTSANLTPASGRQDHTTSPSAAIVSRQRAL